MNARCRAWLEALAADYNSSVDQSRKEWYRGAMTRIQGRRAAEQLKRLSALPPQEPLLDEGIGDCGL